MKEQISDDNKLLKRIKVKLDELLSDSLKPDEILSHALYQLIRKDKEKSSKKLLSILIVFIYLILQKLVLTSNIFILTHFLAGSNGF